MLHYSFLHSLVASAFYCSESPSVYSLADTVAAVTQWLSVFGPMIGRDDDKLMRKLKNRAEGSDGILDCRVLAGPWHVQDTV